MTEREKVPIDMKLKVVLLEVSDVDAQRRSSESLGWRRER